MMTEPRDVWYCTHCGGERPEQPGFKRVDERYSIVLCRTGNEVDSDGCRITVPRHRLVLDEMTSAPLGRPFPGVRSRIEAVAMVKARRTSKDRQRERRITQLGDDYWSNKTKRHQLAPVPVARPRQEGRR